MSDVASAVAGTVADLFGGSASDVAPETVNSPDEAAAPEAHEAVVLPDLNPTLPDDIADLLDEPDFDEVEAPEIIDHSEDEYIDPEELARENAKLRKKLAWTEEQKAKATQKSWAEEAKKYAPLSTPDTIKATSRRAFLREARRQHDTNYNLLKPHIEALQNATAAAAEAARAEAKAQAKNAWGKPTVASGVAPSEAVEKADKLQAARNSRDLTKVAKALLEGNQI